MDLHMKTNAANRSVHLVMCAADAVHTATNNITLLWCLHTCEISSKIYLIGLGISDFSLREIIGLPADLLFYDFMAIVLSPNNVYRKGIWKVK